MITITMPFNNPLTQKTYQDLINSLQFHQMKCTCGHAGSLTIHGYYTRSLKSEDTAISLSIYRIATRYGVIENGRMIEEFTKEELDDRCKQYIKLKVDDTKKASYIIEEYLGTKKYEVLPERVIHLYDLFHSTGEVNKVLVKNDIIVDAISLEGADLEAYFMKLMGGKENA